MFAFWKRFKQRRIERRREAGRQYALEFLREATGEQGILRGILQNRIDEARHFGDFDAFDEGIQQALKDTRNG